MTSARETPLEPGTERRDDHAAAILTHSRQAGDFDAARSVFQTGAGDYHLKPTVKIMPVSAAGAIAGTVSPDSTLTTVYALQGADTLGSTITATNGHFLLGTLAPGTYSVAFDPPIGYRDTTLFGVGVTVGATTEVGTVQLTAE